MKLKLFFYNSNYWRGTHVVATAITVLTNTLEVIPKKAGVSTWLIQDFFLAYTGL